MRRGPKLEPIVLTTEENNRLLEWTRRHKTSQALALRARIVLACQQDRSNRELRGSCGSRSRPWANGAGAFWRSGLTVCSMNRGPVRRARSAMRRSSR